MIVSAGTSPRTGLLPKSKFIGAAEEMTIGRLSPSIDCDAELRRAVAAILWGGLAKHNPPLSFADAWRATALRPCAASSARGDPRGDLAAQALERKQRVGAGFSDLDALGRKMPPEEIKMRL